MLTHLITSNTMEGSRPCICIQTANESVDLPLVNIMGIRKIRDSIQEHGIEFVIASMVDGSIGYYSPHTAYNVLKGILRSGRSYSERGMACYHYDGVKEVLGDIRYFSNKVSYDKAYCENVIAYTKERLKGESSFANDMLVSCMYPTVMSIFEGEGKN